MAAGPPASTFSGRDEGMRIGLAVGPANGKADLELVKRYRDGSVEQIVLALAGRNLDRFLARLDDMAAPRGPLIHGGRRR